MEIDTEKLSGIRAQDLLKKLGLEEPPYDPFDIAKKLGIKVDTTLDFDNYKYSGSISVVNGACVIFVNKYNIYERQRFTVAHELGHYVNDILTHNADHFLDTANTLYRSDISDPREIRANQFAAELLMPEGDIVSQGKSLFAKQAELNLTPELFIEKMAKIFQVSKPAMMIRLKNIDF